jgi:ABC-type lipoprotein export system ATPase subunit
MDTVLEAVGLYHIFRGATAETIALRGVDLTLTRGSWTSVTGPSGSGKSTLLHVLAGLLEPSGGAVTVDGEDLTRLPPPERARRRRRRFGVVLQRDNLHPLFDARGNVEVVLRLDGRGGRAARARATRVLAEVGMSDRHRHRTAQLSGGEAQRTAVAVALAAEPLVLLADEPTGELDGATAAGLLDLLGRVRDEGTAVMTVTHDREVAARADRRLTIRDGIVTDEG